MAIDSASPILVSECAHCKIKFERMIEKERHMKEIHGRSKERFQCPRCDKNFGNEHILQLHLKVHEFGVGTKPTLVGNNIIKERSGGDVDNKELSVVSQETPTTNERLQSSPPPAKKLVGLTKIRLEDCLRCDACSCIYIDANDYNKHMKNFHRQDSPKKHARKKKGCRACCKNCSCNGNHQLPPSLQKERGNNNLFHYNIKDRWSKMVSRRLTPAARIKADPDYDPDDPPSVLDYSHLLSQVEVKIKVEPPDDPEYRA